MVVLIRMNKTVRNESNAILRNPVKVFSFLLMGLVACSPNKKITVPADEVFTRRWKGSSEQSVQASMGPYKAKKTIQEGFLLRFDYSYVISPALSKNEVQIRASNQQSSAMNPWSNTSHSGDHRSPDDSVVRRLDFYFDKSMRVQHVTSEGFPDSVYYIKRRP